jgi:hypothetical protein
MKKLEEYVNENQVNESLFDFLKNLFKAAGKSISKSIHDTYEKEYPNFMKAFDELQQADAEDKELIQKFNTMYETIDKMKDVSDNEKVFHKLNLVMAETGRFEDGEQGEGVKKLDKEKHKGYLEDLQKKLKDIETNHKEIYDKYQEAAKKGEIKKEDIIGSSEGEQDQRTPAEIAAEEHANTIKAVLKETGLSEDIFKRLNIKLKNFMKVNTGGTNENRVSLEDFIINEASGKIAAEDVRKKLFELLNSEDEKIKNAANTAFTYLLIGYIALNNVFDKKLTPDAVRAIIVGFNQSPETEQSNEQQ